MGRASNRKVARRSSGKAIMAMIAYYEKYRPVTVAHNCDPTALERLFGPDPLRGICRPATGGCGRIWVRCGLGWEPIEQVSMTDLRSRGYEHTGTGR